MNNFHTLVLNLKEKADIITLKLQKWLLKYFTINSVF